LQFVGWGGRTSCSRNHPPKQNPCLNSHLSRLPQAGLDAAVSESTMPTTARPCLVPLHPSGRIPPSASIGRPKYSHKELTLPVADHGAGKLATARSSVRLFLVAPSPRLTRPAHPRRPHGAGRAITGRCASRECRYSETPRRCCL
jgi:hypothetical protein